MAFFLPVPNLSSSFSPCFPPCFSSPSSLLLAYQGREKSVATGGLPSRPVSHVTTSNDPSSWSRTSACSGVGSPCLEPSSSNSRPFGVSFCHVAPRSPRDGGHLSSTSSRNLLSLSFFFFFFSVGCLRVETRSRRFNFLRLRPRRPSGKGLVALSLSFTNVFVCGPSSIEAWCGFRTNPREEPASLEQCRRCPLKPLFFFFFC